AARRLAALVGRELRRLRVRRTEQRPQPEHEPAQEQRKAEEHEDVRELEQHFFCRRATLASDYHARKRVRAVSRGAAEGSQARPTGRGGARKPGSRTRARSRLSSAPPTACPWRRPCPLRGGRG